MNYKWERYWILRDKGNVYFAGNGFPIDPKQEISEFYEYFPKLLSDFREISCLVMLGEPGMGKSTTLEKEYKEIENIFSASQDKVLRVNLNSYSNEDRLVKDIFETEVYISWIRGSHNLYLFLDSFDECRLRIETLHSVILRELQKVPIANIERLKIRIACRTAVWPHSLEDGLKDLYDRENKEKEAVSNVLVLELVPLCERDIREASDTEGLNADEFLDEIEKHAVQSLACRPITLSFLMRLFKQYGKFPENKNDIFRQGLLELVKEDNGSRRETGRTGLLTASRRYVLAGRIAFITLFANKPSLRMDNVPDGNNNAACLFIDSLYGESKSEGREGFEVNQAAIKEVLDTGIFTARGATMLGFAHQQYAEFLAADYLITKNINLNKVHDILFADIDGKRRIIPQLHEVAAWLAGMNDKIFEEVIAASPEVLILANAFIPSNEMKARLVTNLLSLNDQGEIANRHFYEENISRLAFPGLMNILIPYLNDKSKSLEARLAAIRIAIAEPGTAIVEILIKLIGDASEAHIIRSVALDSLSHLALEDRHYKVLKGSLLADMPEDEDDDLRGYILKILWPAHLQSEELFALLSPPKRQHYIGSYSSFLSYELPRLIGKQHVLPGLAWLAKVQLSHDDFSFHPLRDAIIITAIHNVQDPDIRKAVIEHFLSTSNDVLLYLHDHGAEVGEFFVAAPTLRNLFLSDCLAHPAISNLYGWHLVRITGLADEDVPWLIDQLKSCADLKKKKLWAGLIPFIFRPESSSFNNFLVNECITCDELRSEMGFWIKAIDLDSEEAKKLRQLILKPAVSQKPDIKVSENEIRNQIDDCIEQIKGGAFFAWWKLAHWFSFEVINDRFVLYEHIADITGGHFWEMMKDSDKHLILSAIPLYINQTSPEKQNRIALAGYKGLALLHRVEPSRISQIDNVAWVKWSSFILGYPHIWPGKGDENHDALLRLVYEKAPSQFLSDIKRMLKKEISGRVSFHGQIVNILDKRIAALMIDMLDEPGISLSSFGDILTFLFDAEREEAYGYCEERLEELMDAPIAEWDRCMVVAAAELMIRNPRHCWAKLNLVDGLNEALAKKIMGAVAIRTGYRRSFWFAKLNKDDQAKLYVWLATKYPDEEDPKHDGAYTPEERDCIAGVKNSILSSLSNAGTHDALYIIDQIAKALPHREWLRWIYLKVREDVFRKSWVPPSPEELNKWLSQPRSRYIQSADQLLEVVLGLLDDYQNHIRASAAKARPLWNETKKGHSFECSPKDEDALSDQVKDYLCEKLNGYSVILNREVHVDKWQRTDIKIDAIRYDGNAPIDILSIIIEVKGCWNSELKTAMETQLLDSYLKGNAYTNGIYLVGWYLCEKWEPEHLKKKGKRVFNDIREAQAFLSKQARDLSTNKHSLTAKVLDLRLT